MSAPQEVQEPPKQAERPSPSIQPPVEDAEEHEEALGEQDSSPPEMEVDIADQGRLGTSQKWEYGDDFQYVLSLGQSDPAVSAGHRHREAIELALALGADARSYRREAVNRLRAVVSEVYSPPRVSQVARRFPRLGIMPGLALDLTGNDENENP